MTSRRRAARFPEGARRWVAWALAVGAVLVLAAYYDVHPPHPFDGPLPEGALEPGAGAEVALRGLLATGSLLWFVTAAAGYGFLLLRFLIPPSGEGSEDVRPHTLERFLLAQGLGFVVVASAVLAAGTLHVLTPPVCRVLLLLPLPWVAFLAVRALAERRVGAAWKEVRGARPSPLVLACALLAVALAVVTWPFAAAPLTANDALVYHLNLPRLYLERGSTEPIAWSAYSRMPHDTELLYTAALGAGPEPAPRLLHAWFRLLVLAVAWAIARRRYSARGAWIAVALLAASPLLSDPRTIGNIDLAQAFVFGAALLCWNRALDREPGRNALCAGLLLGLGAGMRYTGLALALLAAIAWAVSVRAPTPDPSPETRAKKGVDFPPWRIHDALQDILALAIGAALVFGPWLVRGARESGNFLYPLFPSLLDGRDWSVHLGKRLLEWQRGMGMGRGLGDWLLLPWNVTVHGETGRAYEFFDGIVGPFFLITVALWTVSARRHVVRDRVLFAMLAFGAILWAWGPQQIRFAMPLLVPAAVLGAGALDPPRGRAAGAADPRPLRAAAGALPWLIVAAGLVHVGLLADRAAKDVRPVLTGTESRDSYLARHVPSYPAFQYVNRELPPDAHILLVWENRTYYLNRPYLADSFFEASQLMELVRTSGSADALATTLRGLGVTHVLYNQLLGRFFGRLYPEEENARLSAFAEEDLEMVGAAGGFALYRLRGGRAEKGSSSTIPSR